MKILYLALSYPIKEGATSLYTDLITEFKNKGHEVMVIAPMREGARIGLNKEGEIQVLRVKTLNLFNTTTIKKGIANILLPYQYIKALKKYIKDIDIDLILIPTPPITLISVLEWVRKRSSAKVYLILRDIFPQNAVDLKFLKSNSITHNFFRKKEIQLYNISDSIGCMSQANIDYVKKHNTAIDFSKLHMLRNWQNLSTHTDVDHNKIKRIYGIENKFVLIFGGNIGKPQKMENIIKLAKACQNIEDVVFFIIGKGTEKVNLIKMIASENLHNVILKDYMPREDYNSLLQIADVGLISLSQDFTIPNYPSKVLSYFNLKIPVLASVDLNTDLGKDLEAINAGLWAEAGNTILLKEKLMLLYNNRELRLKMGRNGYDYMNKHLLPSNAYSIIMNHV